MKGIGTDGAERTLFGAEPLCSNADSIRKYLSGMSRLLIKEGEVAGDVAGADRPFELAGIGIAEELAAGGEVR